MKRFTFRYDIGAIVWKINKHSKRFFIECDGCKGSGKLKLLNDEIVSCPKCSYHHSGQLEREGAVKWHVTGAITIGQQGVEIEANSCIEQYMCNETGIGSGSIHNVETLFATEKEAQIECDRLNK